MEFISVIQLLFPDTFDPNKTFHAPIICFDWVFLVQKRVKVQQIWSKYGNILKFRKFQFLNISINIEYIHDLIFLKSVSGHFYYHFKRYRPLQPVWAEI